MEDWNTNTPIEIHVQGFDAATLNGLPPSFYLSAENLTGTINPENLPDLDWSKITGKPTTLAGYGIGDAYTQSQINSFLSNKQNLNANLTSIGGLSGTGLLRNTGGVWGLDNNSYLTNNQLITLTGAVTGSGSSSINTTLSNLDASKITSGTIADARINGTYTGLASISGSGDCTFNAFYAKNTASWDTAAGRITTAQNNRLQIVGIPPVDGGTRTIELNGTLLNSINIASTSVKGITFSSTINSVASPRWFIQASSLTSEIGGNVGSDFFISTYNDSGVGNGSAFKIERSTKNLTIYSSTPATSTTSGALSIVGGASCQGDFHAGGTLNGQLVLKQYTTATEPAPSAGLVGTVWFNTTTQTPRICINANTIKNIALI